MSPFLDPDLRDLPLRNGLIGEDPPQPLTEEQQREWLAWLADQRPDWGYLS